MDETAEGFRLDGDTLFPWGILFKEVVPDFEGTGYASRNLPCSSAYGFATRYVEVTAPRPDRPVMVVAYELSGENVLPKDVFAQLVIRLGAPEKVERDEMSPHANSPDHVILHANWRKNDRPIGLSLYGAPRPPQFGTGIGKLYVSWGNVEKAAAPWMPAWQAAKEEVHRAAQSPGKVKTFSVRYDVLLKGEGDWRSVANLCLGSPELVDTPEPFANKLGDKGFALWSDAAGTRWHLSTAAYTIVLATPETSKVVVANIEPARGGGYSTIDVGHWWVRDEWNSRAVADAVRELERVPGLTIQRHSGHDA
jgi:hypothetical protein